MVQLFNRYTVFVLHKRIKNIECLSVNKINEFTMKY